MSTIKKVYAKFRKDQGRRVYDLATLDSCRVVRAGLMSLLDKALGNPDSLPHYRGICGLLDQEIKYLTGSDLTRSTWGGLCNLYLGWPEHSGFFAYPVRRNGIERWAGENLKNRISLLIYSIRKIEHKMEEEFKFPLPREYAVQSRKEDGTALDFFGFPQDAYSDSPYFDFLNSVPLSRYDEAGPKLHTRLFTYAEALDFVRQDFAYNTDWNTTVVKLKPLRWALVSKSTGLPVMYLRTRQDSRDWRLIGTGHQGGFMCSKTENYL